MILNKRSIINNSSISNNNTNEVTRALHDPVVAAINDDADDYLADGGVRRRRGRGGIAAVNPPIAKSKPDLRRIFSSPVFYSINVVSICSCFSLYVKPP